MSLLYIVSVVFAVGAAIRGREKNKGENWSEEDPQEKGTKAISPTMCEGTRIR